MYRGAVITEAAAGHSHRYECPPWPRDDRIELPMLRVRQSHQKVPAIRAEMQRVQQESLLCDALLRAALQVDGMPDFHCPVLQCKGEMTAVGIGGSGPHLIEGKRPSQG